MVSHEIKGSARRARRASGDTNQGVICAGRGANSEPLAEDEVVTLGVLLIKVGHDPFPGRATDTRQASGGGREICHARCLHRLLLHDCDGFFVLQLRQIAQTGVFEAAAADGLLIVSEGLGWQAVLMVDLLHTQLLHTQVAVSRRRDHVT